MLKSFQARIVALFVLSGVLLAAVAFEVDRSARRFRDASEGVAETLARRDRVITMLAAVRAVEADQRAFLLTGLDRDLEQYLGALAEVKRSLLRLEADGADTTELARLARARLTVLDRVFELRRSEGLEAARAHVSGGDGVRAMAVLDDAVAHWVAAADARLAGERARSSASSLEMRVITPLAIAACGLMLAAAFWLIQREQARRVAAEAELGAAARRLSDSVQESHRHAEELRALSEFAELLQSCQNVDEALAGVRTAFASLMPHRGGRLALVNASQNMVAIGAHWGLHTLIAESVFAPDDCWALRRGQIHPQPGQPGGFVCRHVHYPNPDDATACYHCIPLSAQGEILGVLTLDGSADLTDTERRLALAATDHLGLAIANLRLQQDLRMQSIRDPLTGLFNRRYLEASFERELARAARRKQSLSVLMLDVDHFKRFNDSFGHEAGDQLLAEFGRLLASHCRSEDIACRFGGEEFTALLIDCDTAAARERAETMRRATTELKVNVRGQRLGPITVSIGVATFPLHGTTPHDLMGAADLALYAAKNSGRNRVELAAAA